MAKNYDPSTDPDMVRVRIYSGDSFSSEDARILADAKSRLSQTKEEDISDLVDSQSRISQSYDSMRNLNEDGEDTQKRHSANNNKWTKQIVKEQEQKKKSSCCIIL